MVTLSIGRAYRMESGQLGLALPWRGRLELVRITSAGGVKQVRGRVVPIRLEPEPSVAELLDRWSVTGEQLDAAVERIAYSTSRDVARVRARGPSPRRVVSRVRARDRIR